MSTARQILGRELRKVAWLVIDVETTGLNAADDRIVELAAWSYSPGDAPQRLLDTLIDPQRPIPAAAQAVHGITDADVQGAPRFGQIAHAVAALLASRVVAAHNAAFDLRFLRAELARAGLLAPIPHVCTMRLPKLLRAGDGDWPLWWACQQLDAPAPDTAHAASADAEATAGVLHRLLQRAGDLTFRELPEIARRMHLHDPFLDSLKAPLWPATAQVVTASQLPLKRRHGGDGAAPRPPSAAQRYLNAVMHALKPLTLSPEARAHLIGLQASLPDDAVQAVHQRIWRGARRRHREDGYVEAFEAEREQRLRACLVALGFDPWP